MSNIFLFFKLNFLQKKQRKNYLLNCILYFLININNYYYFVQTVISQKKERYMDIFCI